MPNLFDLTEFDHLPFSWKWTYQIRFDTVLGPFAYIYAQPASLQITFSTRNDHHQLRPFLVLKFATLGVKNLLLNSKIVLSFEFARVFVPKSDLQVCIFEILRTLFKFPLVPPFNFRHYSPLKNVCQNFWTFGDQKRSNSTDLAPIWLNFQASSEWSFEKYLQIFSKKEKFINIDHSCHSSNAFVCTIQFKSQFGQLRSVLSNKFFSNQSCCINDNSFGYRNGLS